MNEQRTICEATHKNPNTPATQLTPMPSPQHTPRQRRLALAPETQMPSRVSKDPHAAGNAQAARVILEDPAKYGGETAGLVQWARAWKAQSGRAPEGQRETH